MTSRHSLLPLALAAILYMGPLAAQAPRRASTSHVTAPHVTAPKDVFGFNVGDDYSVANYSQLTAYFKKLAAESNRVKLVDIGPTAEGRRHYMAIVSSPA